MKQARFPGERRRYPVLRVFGSDGVPQVVVPLIELFDNYRDTKSDQWMLLISRGLGLLVDFTIQMGPWVGDMQAQWGDDYLEKVWEKFTTALVEGTVSTGGDNTGLYWLPRSVKSARDLLRAIEHYIDWLDEKGHASAWKSDFVFVNGPANAVSGFRMAYARKVIHDKSLLFHLKGKPTGRRSRAADRLRSLRREKGHLKRFPENYVVSMLFDGFALPNGEFDETAEIIAHILFLGGLRMSEPLHLWVQDVQFASGVPIIALHHPQESLVQGFDGVTRSRAETLKRFFHMESRNAVSGKYWSGWKGILGDLNDAIVHWLPIEGVEDHISSILRHYLLVTRPRIMALRHAAGLPDHPYLFVSTAIDGEEIGAPYTRSSFRAAWKRAVNRLKRKHRDDALKHRKDHGTTPHGARHFYGHYLSQSPIQRELIQQCMHHLDPFSQLVYTEPTPEEVDSVLKTGAPLKSKFDGSVFAALRNQQSRTHWEKRFR
ncbi:hypothetical protein ATY75_15420 [Rhizobium sp. N122]|nr:hypothetical protein ATY75_15420 [Rhizobium sp. N122]